MLLQKLLLQIKTTCTCIISKTIMQNYYYKKYDKTTIITKTIITKAIITKTINKKLL